MKPFFNHVRESGVVVVLATSVLACSEAPLPSPSEPNGGSSGQASGGNGAAGVAGASGMPTGGALPAASGAAGMSGMSGNGGAGGGGGASGDGASGGGASGAAGVGGSGGAAADGWVPLFNGTNLDGWTPSPGATQFFGVSQLEGAGVIHVYPTQADQSEQPIASLRTNDSYSSYVLHLEYKWGVDRFGERKQTDRDNGICFHICNDPTKVWPDSLELQIGSQAWPGDWVTGNVFMLVDKTRAQWPFTMMNGQEVFSENGTKKSIGAPAQYYKALAPSNLDKKDAWNIIELTVHGSEDAEYKVNGTVVNRLFDMECNEGGTWKPLDHGPIALQAEFAEVYFRDVRIKVLP